MSDHTISLAFSVLHHYLKLFAEKQEPHLPLPSFPSQFKQVDISPFLSQAEHLVLGKQPELKQSNKLFSLFETIHQENKETQFSYDFQPLSPNTIFPKKEENNTALSVHWDKFINAINEIPKSHCDNPSLWLDHFDTAM